MIDPVSRSSALAWLPSMEMLPEVGTMRPPRICMSVVLPSVGADEGGDGGVSEGERDVAQRRLTLSRIRVTDGVEGDHELSLTVVSAP